MTSIKVLNNLLPNTIKSRIKVSGDKSISHRSLMLASQMVGVTKISGLLESEDVIATKDALLGLGVEIFKKENDWCVKGIGIGSFVSRGDVLDLQNSGTAVRLLMGLIATQKIKVIVTGDDSLRKRPMRRATEPLKMFGAEFIVTGDNYLPMTIIGSDESIAINYEVPVPSAQVKSALLFAAINAYGTTTITESKFTRDHTELMMQYLGFNLDSSIIDGKKEIKFTPGNNLPAKDIKVPGDPSSAAFLTAFALLHKNADLLISDVNINEYRIGFYIALQKMGAKISFENERVICGEKIADIRVRSSDLSGIELNADIAPTMIDEYPIFAVVASFARGITRMSGLAELKVKESDRFSAIYDNLINCGVNISKGDDTLIIESEGELPQGGAIISTHMDHRIAMSFIILGLFSKKGVTIDDISMINTSFPEFFTVLEKIGIKLL